MTPTIPISIAECIAWAADVEKMNPAHPLYQECRDATIAHLERVVAIDAAALRIIYWLDHIKLDGRYYGDNWTNEEFNKMKTLVVSLLTPAKLQRTLGT